MFDRFTDRSRRVMGLARQEALDRGEEFIGTEHVLVALLVEGRGVAANVLEELGVTAEKARSEVEKCRPRQSRPVVLGALPFTPRCKTLLETSVAAARRLGHNYIGTEHLLLGLVADGEGAAIVALAALGVTREAVRRKVELVLGVDEDAGAAATAVAGRLAGQTGHVLVRHRWTAQRSAFAELVHKLSGATGPFVALDAASVSEADLERELFSRAVADPHSMKPQVLGVGAAAGAERGTLFLDRVDRLSLRLQERLAGLLAVKPFSVHAPFAADPRNPFVRLRLVAGIALDPAVLAKEGKLDGKLLASLGGAAVEIPDDPAPASPVDSQPKLSARGLEKAAQVRNDFPMAEIKAAFLAKRLGPSDAAVLVRGPSAEARLAVARKLHEESERRERPFVVLDCGGTPPEILEGAVFGIRKGTTFGGEVQKPGALLDANEGTLFLDRVDALPATLQEKLLRALETREYARLGESVPTKLGSVRLVTGTTLDLSVLVSEGKFLAGLFYRINVGLIDLTPPRGASPGLSALIGLMARTGTQPGRAEIEKFLAEIRKLADATPSGQPPLPAADLAKILADFQLLTPDQVAKVLAFRERLAGQLPRKPGERAPLSPGIQKSVEALLAATQDLKALIEKEGRENPRAGTENPEPALEAREQDRVRPLFDRLSRRSDKVLEIAREEARRLGHPDVGSEHLLLGIAREGSGLAAIVLLELLSDLGKIGPAVAASRTRGAPPVALGFAPSAQAALDTADEVAQDLGRDTVDPEHLLIGIARDAEGSGGILRSLGLDPATVEARVRIRLSAI